MAVKIGFLKKKEGILVKFNGYRECEKAIKNPQQPVSSGNH
jgi:hypothetical protein